MYIYNIHTCISRVGLPQESSAAALRKESAARERRVLAAEAEAKRERERSEASSAALRSLSDKHGVEMAAMRLQQIEEQRKGEVERAKMR